MELTVESEETLQRPEIEKNNELECEEDDNVEGPTEKKHGVGCKIINTSNDSCDDAAPKLNNGSVSDCDRKNSTGEDDELFEHNIQDKIQPGADDIPDTDECKNATSPTKDDNKKKNHKNHSETPHSKNNSNDEEKDDEQIKNNDSNNSINDDAADDNKNEEKEKSDVMDVEDADEPNKDEAVPEAVHQEDSFEVKSASKKTGIKKKKEEKEDDDLKLFDDVDLPLKGTKRDGRGKKKKSTESTVDNWDRVGKISGKIFDEEDEDDGYSFHNHYDYEGDDNDEYTTFKQASLAKKGGVGEKLWTDVGKKAKVDPLGRKFIKTPLASEKKKPAESSRAGKASKSKSQLQRKEVWLRGWEKKLRGVENELEGRVGWVRRNEGRIMREERRLAEKEALLGYREQLLLSVPLDNDEGIKKLLEESMERLKKYAGWVDEQKRVFEEVGGARGDDGQLKETVKAIDTLPLSRDGVVGEDGGGGVK